jgi:carbamoylphosphate synthase small subunit
MILTIDYGAKRNIQCCSAGCDVTVLPCQRRGEGCRAEP